MSPQKTPQMAVILDAAQALANAHRELLLRAQQQESELMAAVAPILARHRPGIDHAAARKAAAQAQLFNLVAAQPQLFVRPRSVLVDGVKAGWQREADGLSVPNEDATIQRIQALYPKLADLLIRTEHSLVWDALPQLDADQRQALGVRRVEGVDQPYVRIGESDVDKLVRALVADADRRQGEDDKPVKAKTVKAKRSA